MLESITDSGQMLSSTEASSDPDDFLQLVDSDDKPVGALKKSDCHAFPGYFHRAFSIYLFNEVGEILLQQRAEKKLLWPAYWSNSCCSHPRVGESLADAADRRLLEELGVSAPLEYVFNYSYEACYRDVGIEREFCHVFVGLIDSEPQFNNDEVKALRFVSSRQLFTDIELKKRLTPWFVIALDMLRSAKVGGGNSLVQGFLQ